MEANRGYRDDGHVEGIEEAPALDEHVAGGAEDGQGDDDEGGVSEVLRDGGGGSAYPAFHGRLLGRAAAQALALLPHVVDEDVLAQPLRSRIEDAALVHLGDLVHEL